MIDWIEHIDQAIVIAVNEWHTPVLDEIMWHISGKWQWIPLYLFLVVLLIRQYRKQIFWPLFSVALVIVLTDQTSVHLFKEMFQRYRPCHHLDLQPILELVHNKCGGKYGFVSSHAANSFGLAGIIGLIFKKYKTLSVFLLSWAALVSFSRVYMAVHYLSDVIVGGILGLFIAFLVYRFFKFKLVV